VTWPSFLQLSASVSPLVKQKPDSPQHPDAFRFVVVFGGTQDLKHSSQSALTTERQPQPWKFLVNINLHLTQQIPGTTQVKNSCPQTSGARSLSQSRTHLRGKTHAELDASTPTSQPGTPGLEASVSASVRWCDTSSFSWELREKTCKINVWPRSLSVNTTVPSSSHSWEEL
jgi:hypothetical protein